MSSDDRRSLAVSASTVPVRAPDLAEIETLVACTSEGSMVGAASRLGISRPAVAKRIRNLETLAGCALLHRGGRGVHLTDAGATLLAGARRMLEERDALLSLLTEMRRAEPSSISGLRDLLGRAGTTAQSAQRAETRLAETERVLDLILRTTTMGVVITDFETGVVHEANEAFCRFIGRTREELLAHGTIDYGDWLDSPERQAMLDTLQRDGVARDVTIPLPQSDGSVRFGEMSTYLITLAGARRVLGVVEDLTGKRPSQRAPETVSAE
jgi:PAS domain S-box-containing protein